jgi:uncharacterized membrane protein
MKPLIVLLATFLATFVVKRFATNTVDVAVCGRIAMSVMLIFTSIGHFVFSKGMEMMVPPFIPFKKAMVYFTGLIEICAAIGLLLNPIRLLTAWLLILFFILLLPANIYAAMKHVDYQKGTFEGNGKQYLWFRVSLQLFFIAWILFFVIIGV